MQNEKRKLMSANAMSEDAGKNEIKTTKQPQQLQQHIFVLFIFLLSFESISVGWTFSGILSVAALADSVAARSRRVTQTRRYAPQRNMIYTYISFIILLFISGCVMLVSLRIYLPGRQFICACVAHAISTLGTCLYCNQNCLSSLASLSPPLSPIQ